MSRFAWPLAAILCWIAVLAAANLLPQGGIPIAFGVSLGWPMLFGSAVAVTFCAAMRFFLRTFPVAGLVIGSWLATIYYAASGSQFDSSLGVSLAFSVCWIAVILAGRKRSQR